MPISSLHDFLLRFRCDDRTTGRMKTPAMQRAWREKMGLISIILLICGAVGFLTFGFTQTVCSSESQNLTRVKEAARGTIIANGFAYNMDVLSFRHPPPPGYKDDNNV